MTNIGKALSAIRRERELSQGELAHRAGISNSYLSEIENGKKSPDLNILESICDALDVALPIVLFKAINEEAIDNPEKKRLVREIKPLFDRISKELYSSQPKEFEIEATS